MLMQNAIRAAYVFKAAGPSSAGISHATVFYIPCGNAGFLQRMAKVAGISQIVLGPPIATVNEEHSRMRTFSGGNSHIDELVLGLTVVDPRVWIPPLLVQGVF